MAGNKGAYSGNGTTLSYVVEGDGVEVVLIHGVGANKESWEDTIAALGPGFRTLRFDLRGLELSLKDLIHYLLPWIGQSGLSP